MQYSIAKLGDEGWAEMPESTVSNRSGQQTVETARPGVEG
jgi:hypothetical protein